jgi:hypothetical protein
MTREELNAYHRSIQLLNLWLNESLSEPHLTLPITMEK